MVGLLYEKFLKALLMRVLIVDDSTIVCRGLRQILSKAADVEIIGEVHDGSLAIQCIPGLKPDVVILDIRLFGPSGIEVLKDIRHKNLPTYVIMLTNYTDPQYRQKCENLGADFFLDKSKESGKIPDLLKELKEKMSPTDLCSPGTSDRKVDLPAAVKKGKVDAMATFEPGKGNM
jgi:DNA-binding NarL/FixJ family response regulator